MDFLDSLNLLKNCPSYIWIILGMCLPNCNPSLCLASYILQDFSWHILVPTRFGHTLTYLTASFVTQLWHFLGIPNRGGICDNLSPVICPNPPSSPPAWHRALEFSSELVYVNNRNKNLTCPSTCRPIFTVLASHRFTFTAEAVFWLPFKFFPLLVVCEVYKHSGAQEAPVCRCIKQSIKPPQT